jgi:hypothetical protein
MRELVHTAGSTAMAEPAHGIAASSIDRKHLIILLQTAQGNSKHSFPGDWQP